MTSWPLNNYIARRSILIQKGVLAARDKRMGILNELIGAVSLSILFSLLVFRMVVLGLVVDLLRNDADVSRGCCCRSRSLSSSRGRNVGLGGCWMQGSMS